MCVRLVTYHHHDGSLRAGVVREAAIVDLAHAAPHLPSSVLELLQEGDDALLAAERAAAEARETIPLASVRLAAPIVRPSKFLGVGLNYAAHVAEAVNRSADAPTVFAKASSCVNGPYDAIEHPEISETLDYEGELGFVIGRSCRNVSREDAPSVIAGYVVVNDVSVREWQWQTTQWTLGKSFDTHGPFGPWLTTCDEVGDPHDLDIRTYVNGELRQDSNTSLLLTDCYSLVEHLSTVFTLEPGDVVATGTPAGVGANMDPPRWLARGDVVRVEIDRLGAIENQVVAGARAALPPVAEAAV
jgi:2-keto-4-pentenoate hydratase/2-oxohepta-3-ene-1,7-dioic acid hydratase in catechol pathway